jgi:cell division protein FtsN
MVAPVRTADRAVAPRPSEPVPPAPAPGPTADLERAPAPQERAPRVAASALPVSPEEEEPVATEPDAPAVGVQPSFGTPSQIQSALESVMTRLPQKELSAPPIERAGMGFIDAPERPGRDGIGELRIAEVTPPAVEIPSFGGIGMLRSDQPDDVTIAEAVPPAPDAPEVVERQSPPAERPDGSEIAQAAPPAADLPEGPGLERAEPATEPFAPSLAGAAPRDEDVRPDEAVEPPVVPVVRVRPGRLPTAQLEPESRPELADVPRASPPAEDPVELTGGIPGAPTGPRDSLDRTAAPELESKYDLVDAQPVSPERPEADLAAPEAEEPDLLLTLEPADFRPPEEEPTDAVALERAEAPGEEPVRTAATEPEAPAGPEASATPRREPDVREEPLVAHSVPEPAEVEPEREAVTEPAEVAATEAPVTPTTPAGLPIVPDLADDSFYLQIGAYNTAEAARDAVAALSSTYPLAVVSSTEMGRAAYRVLVGPLAEDETGTTLYWLRAKGYRDSFVRRGNEL